MGFDTWGEQVDDHQGNFPFAQNTILDLATIYCKLHILLQYGKPRGLPNTLSYYISQIVAAYHIFALLSGTSAQALREHTSKLTSNSDFWSTYFPAKNPQPLRMVVQKLSEPVGKALLRHILTYNQPLRSSPTSKDAVSTDLKAIYLEDLRPNSLFGRSTATVVCLLLPAKWHVRRGKNRWVDSWGKKGAETLPLSLPTLPRFSSFLLSRVPLPVPPLFSPLSRAAAST